VAVACTLSVAGDKPPVLYTQAYGPGVYASTTAVVGVPFPVTVSELALPGGNCGGTMCPPSIEVLSLVGASCDDGACTATTDGKVQASPAFVVTPTKPGPTTLHVTVKARSGATYEDTLALTIAASGTIGVYDHAYKELVGRTRRASLVGTDFAWLVTLEANGKRCAASLDAFAVTIDGDAFAPTGAINNEPGVQLLKATRPGTAHVRVVAGTATRDIALTAADPADVTAIELHALTVPPGPPQDKLDVEAEDNVAPDALATANVSVSYEKTEWAVLVRLKDGTTAIGGADQLSIIPAGLGKTGSVNGVVLAFSPQKNHVTGTVTGTIGAASLSIPLSIATK
jgi:hypothetical protein